MNWPSWTVSWAPMCQFLWGHAAFAEGVGEQLQPVEIKEKWYLVLVPPCHVSTAAVFQHPDLKRDTPKAMARVTTG